MEQVYLPDDIFYYLMKYLDSVDCMSLSIARVWPRFTYLYQQNKEINLRGGHRLPPNTFQSFFRELIIPARVKTLNLNNCCWIPASSLLRAITKLPQLEELHAENTALNFNHFPLIFKKCTKVTRLAFTLKQPKVKNCGSCIFKKGNYSGLSDLQGSFAQLTHLKIVWHDSDLLCCLIVLEILGWCLKCRDLHLEPYFDMETPSEKQLDYTRAHLFPKLRWMENLKSFICYHMEVRQRNPTFFDALYQWISTKLKFKNIERFWYGTEENLNVTVPFTIKSWQFGRNMPLYPLEQFTELTEIGGAKLKLVPRLPKLRLADGMFSSFRVLYKFLKRHPLLEHLFIKPVRKFKIQPYKTILPDDFQMPNLRTLTYTCGFLDPDVLIKLLKIGCNMENLSITANAIDLSGQPLDQVPNLKRLKKLSILAELTGSAEIFEKIFTGCTQLERFYFWGKHMDRSPDFLDAFCNAITMATDLQELSLTWEESICPCRFKKILFCVAKCHRMKRFHLDLVGTDVDDEEESKLLADFVVDIVRQLKCLEALSLHLRDCSLNVQRQIKKRIYQKILPERPTFWFCLDIYSSKISVHSDVVSDSPMPCALLSK